MTTPNIRTALKRLVELDKRIEDVIPGIEIDNWIDAMDAARAALKPDDMPPAPLSEDDLRQRWNQQADEYNQWESLDFCEQLAWAQALAIRADRHAAALKAKPQTPPTDDAWHELISEIARVQHVAAGEGQGGRIDLAKAVKLWCRPAASPEPETPAEALAVRPLLERVAQLGDVIGRQTVAQVQQLATEAQAGEVAELVPVGELDDQRREAVHQAVVEALGPKTTTAWPKLPMRRSVPSQRPPRCQLRQRPSLGMWR